jgi:acyl-coenzyme A synthetase/AMP-(fatty) acid ligase
MKTPDNQITSSAGSRSWVHADLSQPEMDIIDSIRSSPQSLLFIPPKYSNIELHIPEIPCDGVHIGLFSSGTTGNPRCMWVSREKLFQNAKFTARHLGIHTNHRVLILASPWHIAGISWALMAIQEGISFDIHTPYVTFISDFVAKLSGNSFTHLFTTPFLFRHLAKHDAWSTDEIVCGGSPLTLEDRPLFYKHTRFITSAYGQTEAGGIISAFRSDTSCWDKPGCVGSPADNVRIRCNGTHDQPGPIYIHSPSAVCEGWLDTGDYGYKDEHDMLYITHRKKDPVNNAIEK